MAKLMKVPPPPEDGVQLVTPKERLDKQIVPLTTDNVKLVVFNKTLRPYS